MSWTELYVDEPARGAWNMAVDQALLEHCEATGRATLRLYQWSPATLSLGYFQRYAERQTHLPSSGLDLVRRATGGGAIVHDRELTYSLCVPSAERWSRANRELYDAVHRAVLAALADEGVAATLFASEGTLDERSQSKVPRESSLVAGCGSVDRTPESKFLCFERRSAGDVILDGFKIGGSAQRRGKQALLQHGSILLQQSDFTPELPGIAELSGKRLDPHLLGEQLLRHLARELDLRFQPAVFSEELAARASAAEQATFAAERWNRNR